MKTGIFVIILILVGILSWIGNFYKLIQCDFESPYKCEIIHAVGIIPAISVLTVWVDSDSK